MWNSLLKPLSWPSKHQGFLSFQIHHIKRWGSTFQMPIQRCLPKQPCQQASKPVTPLGITHWIPKMLKTNNWSALANSQWMKQVINYFLTLPIHTTPINYNVMSLPKISVVRILTKAAIQVKYAILDGTSVLGLPNTLPWERRPPRNSELYRRTWLQTLYIWMSSNTISHAHLFLLWMTTKYP